MDQYELLLKFDLADLKAQFISWWNEVGEQEFSQFMQDTEGLFVDSSLEDNTLFISSD